jgi:tetratricopeptide (TPR) repeat protein
MSVKDKKLFCRQESTRHFLFSSTDPGRVKRTKTAASTPLGKALQSAFPQVLTGSRFIKRVLQQLEAATCFAAMVARIDSSLQDGKKPAEASITAGQLELATILSDSCSLEKGWWGILEPGILSAVFPGKTDRQCLELAGRIQEQLARQNGRTATLGVAAYPNITYPREKIFENASKALEHAAFFGPNSAVAFDAVSLNISGDKLYENGNVKGAIAEFKKALELDGANVNVHNSLGVCYGLQGKYDQAMQEFKTAAALDGSEYMALYNMGLINKLTGHPRQALDFFLKAGKVRPTVFEIAFQTGKLYLELEKPEKAAAFLEQAAELEPESSTVLRFLGDCHEARGRPQAAITAYTRAIRQNPQDAAAMSALGHLFDRQGENLEIALMFCRESVALAPEDGLLRYRLGQLYYHQNRVPEALNEFKKAEQLGYDASGEISKIENQKKAAK